MIQHKREEFLSDSGHRALVVSGLFCGCVALDLMRVYPKMTEVMPDSRGVLIPAVLFAALSVFLLLRGVLKAGKRKKCAMESRRGFLQNGIISHGKVIAAGGGYYQKGDYREQHIRQNKSRHFYTWESRWWAEIEYYNEIKGIYSRYRVIDLNKNPRLHHLVGKDVQLYQNEGQAVGYGAFPAL